MGGVSKKGGLVWAEIIRGVAFCKRDLESDIERETMCEG